MILGCDAAGLDEDGNEVLVHAVVSDPDWTRRRDARPAPLAALRALPGHLRRQGRRAARATWSPSPPRCRSRRPPACRRRGSRPTGCCSSRAACKPGDTVLVQGAGGGVATALIALARAGGLQVLATSRDEAKRARALEHRRPRGLRDRCPAAGEGRRGDGDRRQGHLVALDPVAAARRHGRDHAARPRAPTLDDAELTRIFFLQLRVIGSTMGTRGELAALVSMLDATGARPLIDRTLPMDRGRATGSRPWRRVTCSARSSSPGEPRIATCSPGPGRASGLALARTLHERGDDLVLVARSDERAAELAAGVPRGAPVVADLARPDALAASTGLPDGSTRWSTPPASSSWRRSPSSTPASLARAARRSTWWRRRC